MTYELYNIFDFTKRNFESFRDDKFPKKNPSILEDEEYISETKATLIRNELKNMSPDNEGYDALLEELILLHTSNIDVNDERKKDIREKVKMLVNGEIEMINDNQITENKKNVADSFIRYKRTLFDEVRDREKK